MDGTMRMLISFGEGLLLSMTFKSAFIMMKYRASWSLGNRFLEPESDKMLLETLIR